MAFCLLLPSATYSLGAQRVGRKPPLTRRGGLRWTTDLQGADRPSDVGRGGRRPHLPARPPTPPRVPHAPHNPPISAPSTTRTAHPPVAFGPAVLQAGRRSSARPFPVAILHFTFCILYFVFPAIDPRETSVRCPFSAAICEAPAFRLGAGGTRAAAFGIFSGPDFIHPCFPRRRRQATPRCA